MVQRAANRRMRLGRARQGGVMRSLVLAEGYGRESAVPQAAPKQNGRPALAEHPRTCFDTRNWLTGWLTVASVTAP